MPRISLVLVFFITLFCLGCNNISRCPEDMAEVVVKGKTVCIDKFENYIIAYKSSGEMYKYSPKVEALKKVDGRFVPGNVFEENDLKDKIYARSTKGIIPVDNVSWIEADIACRNSKKRLCRKDEWEAACSDGKGQPYPYGNEYKEEKCNGYENGMKKSFLSVLPAGHMLECKNSNGVFDLSGNLWEWVFDSDNTGSLRLVKGGGFANSGYDEEELSCKKNKYQPPNIRLSGVGFRCCKER